MKYIILKMILSVSSTGRLLSTMVTPPGIRLSRMGISSTISRIPATMCVLCGVQPFNFFIHTLSENPVPLGVRYKSTGKIS